MSDLYNKAALERLSSPEQLDKAITVSKPASWLVLLGIAVVIVAAIIWSVLGTLPTVLPTHGISIHSEGDGEQIVESYVPYSLAGQINTGMRATIHNPLDDTRFQAEVIEIYFDYTQFTNMDLVLGGGEIPVVILLQLDEGYLSERTLVTAYIVTEEVAPLEMLFRGITEWMRG